MTEALIALSRRLGDPAADLAILAEGNASVRVDGERFLVKASGHSMATLGEDGVSAVRFQPILAAWERELSDDDVRALLREASDGGPLPSVETFMHAWLLTIPDVVWVGHTHPTPLISLLSLDEAKDLSRRRLFPDEIVCCGPASAFVPYTDPGLPLARAIADSVRRYIEDWGAAPKTIWLQNHGLIVLGKSPREIESGSLMSAKAARAWLGLLATGRPIHDLTQGQIARIHTRPDEHYRQRLLAAL